MITVRNENGVLTYYNDGVQITAAQARTLFAATADGTQAVNRKALLDKAQTAITNNVTYLGVASPTTAQNTAQIKALTRQVNALLRLAAGLLADTSGT